MATTYATKKQADDMDKRAAQQGRPYRLEIAGVPSIYCRTLAEVSRVMRTCYPHCNGWRAVDTRTEPKDKPRDWPRAFIRGLSFSAATLRLGGRESVKVDNNTILHRIDDDTIGVRLHDTDVVRILSDGTYRLDSGGWHTSTTQNRIAKYAGACVHRKDETLYVDGVPLVDGMAYGPIQARED